MVYKHLPWPISCWQEGFLASNRWRNMICMWDVTHRLKYSFEGFFFADYGENLQFADITSWSAIFPCFGDYSVYSLNQLSEEVRKHLWIKKTRNWIRLVSFSGKVCHFLSSWEYTKPREVSEKYPIKSRQVISRKFQESMWNYIGQLWLLSSKLHMEVSAFKFNAD